MSFVYMSGDEIKKGDQVLFHGEPGKIDFIADPLIFDSDTHWYVEEFGGGVMVVEPKYFGSAFLSEPENAEDLELVGRSEESEATG